MLKKLTSFLTMLPLAVLAHPGHGDEGGFTITHYFTEPEHIWVFVISGLLVLYAAGKFAKRNAGQ